jgi:hypothetical protein
MIEVEEVTLENPIGVAVETTDGLVIRANTELGVIRNVQYNKIVRIDVPYAFTEDELAELDIQLANRTDEQTIALVVSHRLTVDQARDLLAVLEVMIDEAESGPTE